MTEITDALRITRSVRLADVDPASTPGFDGDKQRGELALAAGADRIGELQERLFAASRAGGDRSVLLMVQGMDTAGKGGIMRHVVGQVDPQGVRIKAFKAPTAAEKRRDFLWRIEKELPAPGMIGVFDRSHYEDVLIHRVQSLTPADEIQERYGRIVEFEQQLAERGIRLIKVMLHVSYEEQGARLLERPTSTGSTTRATSTSASTGRRTWRPTRSPSTARRALLRRGTWCPPTASGSHGSR